MVSKRANLAAAAATITVLVASSQAVEHDASAAHQARTPRTTARVFVTTPDGKSRMSQRAPVTFGPVRTDANTVVVNPAVAYQRMDGFGGALTDSSAAVLMSLSPAARDRAMRSLFDPKQGIGMSLLRQPIGSSDFTAARTHYTYDDVAAGQTDFTLSHFSIAHDRARVLPLLRQAKRLNPKLRIVASPWSPPAWMKTNGSLVRGRLKPGEKYARAYAKYLTRFVQAYTAAGVPVDYLTVQNEPQARQTKGYPGTDLPVADEIRVINELGPMLKHASPRTRILGYDHNWATHPNDVKSTPAGRDAETDYPYRLLKSSAARWISGTAFHCYSGDPSAQTALHRAFPHKGVYFTECSGSHTAGDSQAKVFNDSLRWGARNLTLGVPNNWGRTTETWNLILNADGTPHLGGCDTCDGVLTRQPDGSVTRGAQYYTLGHLSKFVRPGARHIAARSFGTTGWNGRIMDSAFRNPDGSIALVVHNENDAARTFTVAVGGQGFRYTLPGGSLATFTWDGHPSHPGTRHHHRAPGHAADHRRQGSHLS